MGEAPPEVQCYVVCQLAAVARAGCAGVIARSVPVAVAIVVAIVVVIVLVLVVVLGVVLVVVAGALGFGFDPDSDQ